MKMLTWGIAGQGGNDESKKSTTLLSGGLLTFHTEAKAGLDVNDNSLQ